MYRQFMVDSFLGGGLIL